MTTVMTTEEFAHRTGADLAALEAAIAEAEADAIPPGSLNPGSLTSRNLTPETERLIERFREASRPNPR